jgi:hypothetical protein
LAVVLVAALLSGCASSGPFHPMADPAARIAGAGFSVLAPGGPQWLLSESSSGSPLAFGKADPALFRQGASVIAVATRERARHGDISTADGLRREVDAYVRQNSQGPVSLTLEPYRDAALGTDCVRIDSRSEERGNPRYPGKVLLLTVAGKACRVPASPAQFVQVTYSSRHPSEVAPVLDDALRRECERFVDSLAFTPGS